MTGDDGWMVGAGWGIMQGIGGRYLGGGCGTETDKKAQTVNTKKETGRVSQKASPKRASGYGQRLRMERLS